ADSDSSVRREPDYWRWRNHRDRARRQRKSSAYWRQRPERGRGAPRGNLPAYQEREGRRTKPL
ncbi:Carbon storage regulator, partial [Pseudomonas sp. FG-3G]